MAHVRTRPVFTYDASASTPGPFMSGTDPDELLCRAEILMREALEILGSTRRARHESTAQVSAIRKENERLKRKIRAVTSENHALHIARRRLVQERNADREVIRKWQFQLDEGSTQDPATAPIPSSPPASNAESLRPKNDESGFTAGLSQPILPQSIGVNELSDDKLFGGSDNEPSGQNGPETESGGPEIETNNGALTQPEYPSFGEPMNIKLESDLTTDAPDGVLSSELDSSSSEHPNAHTGTEVSHTSQTATDHDNMLATFQGLVGKDWHPADFKVNPDYDSKVVLSRVNDTRKEHRKCLHGVGCQDCSRFYRITGLMGAIQAGSRHRNALDKQPTPMGFWTMDFPVSSQTQGEAGLAQRQWLDEGRQRLEEALVGGRYIFRDDALNKLVETYHGSRN